jgi:hypothetical protein
MFVSTDSHGQISIFGFGSEASYLDMPKEQFFHTDYMPLIRERNTILDERTKLPPHCMPYPFLVNFLRVPHEPRIQRMIEGKAALTNEEFQKYLVKQDDQVRIEDGLEEVPYQTAYVVNKNLIQPLNEIQLRFVDI